MDGDAHRAKTFFFVCVAFGMVDLVAIDFWIGPRAFAAPAATAEVPPATSPPAPSPTPTHTASAPPPPEPAADAAVETAGLDASGGRITGVVARFEFEKADADLTQLRLLAKQMLEDPSSEVVLEGHADPSGNEYKNLSLSLDRAIWAKERLVELGVPPQRIRTVGLGSARPLAENVEDAGSVNRRVEVRWVSKSPDGGGRE